MEETISAAAAHVETPATETANEPVTQETPATETTLATDAQPTSAAAAHAAHVEPKADEPKTDEPKTDDVDLASMSDEDWAKAVMPDPENEGDAKPDRTILSPMAKELREGGIQPAMMKKIVSAYEKSVDAYVKDQNAKRSERMAELNKKCETEVSAEDWKNFGAAYSEHIANDKDLKDIVDHTELGSNPAFIKLIALAGATLRVDEPPSAAAAGGTSQSDLDRRVFEATVPKHLR